MSKEKNKVDINKHEIDIDTLFKQNVNDLTAIKELYRKLQEVEERFSQIKYIDSTLAYKLKKEYEKFKKEYENFKKIILNENIQIKLTNDIEKINLQLDSCAKKDDVTRISSGTPLFASSVIDMTDVTRNYVNTTDGYLYRYNGNTFEKTTVLYQATGIEDKLIDEIREKLNVDLGTIDYIKSVNLFDKSAVINGKYINMSNGNLSTNANFSASDYIEVEPSTSYCFSNFNNGTQGAYYDSSKVFISGIGTKVSTSPSNAKYMRFGCPSVDVPTMQLQKGKNTTAYEPYGGKFISYESISSEAKSKLSRQASNVKKVALDGSCDYTSISSAVDNANSEIVIQVMPGVYDNIVKGFGKDISIIGIDKKRCILKNTTGDYKTPPLEMTHGYLANMTIYAEKLEGATIPSMLTYAIHIDRSASRNKTLLIENCDFYSDWNACAGIGTWANFTLTFKNCNFYMNNPTQTNGAIFFHNAGVEGELNQNIIFDNCRIYSKSDVGIYIGDALTNGNSPLNATFINTLIYSSTKGKDCIKTTSGSKLSGNNISLTGDSYGNNITILNAN